MMQRIQFNFLSTSSVGAFKVNQTLTPKMQQFQGKIPLSQAETLSWTRLILEDRHAQGQLDKGGEEGSISQGGGEYTMYNWCYHIYFVKPLIKQGDPIGIKNSFSNTIDCYTITENRNNRLTRKQNQFYKNIMKSHSI